MNFLNYFKYGINFYKEFKKKLTNFNYNYKTIYFSLFIIGESATIRGYLNV